MVFEVDTAWLETIFRKYESEKNIARVKSAKCEAAIGEAENYCSQIFRVNMEVVLESGRSATRSVIIKDFPKTQNQMQINQQTLLFKNETKMYTEVFPMMEKLIEENSDKTEKLWCDCYSYTPYSQLVMEDLKEKSYTMVERTKGLDLEHTLLAVRALGKFHAISYALLVSGRLSPEGIRQSGFAENGPFLNNLFKGGIDLLVKDIKSSWDPKWKSTVKKLEPLLESDTIGRRIAELYNTDTGFKAYIHGDFWCNNMLFKYNSDTGSPINIRLIDFQLSSCSSPAWDLTYFMFSSLQLGVRRDHFDEIINTYTDSLWQTLSSCNVTLINVPNTDDIRNEIDRLLFYGLIISCFAIPIRMNKKGMEFENIFSEDSKNTNAHNPEMFTNKECIKFLQDDLEYFLSKGAI